MTRIGIITILKVNNYGAELQAYATQAVLRNMGYDAEIIDYLFYKNPEFIKTKHSAPSFHFPLKKRMAEYIYPILSHLKNIPNGKALNRRNIRFARFHQEHTSMSQTYKSTDELYLAHMNYDVYMTGSDQVWNPGIYSSLSPYFLDFAPQGHRRIAYSASFGVSQIPEYARNFYSKHLQTYNSIGVREKNAVDMVRDIANMEAQWVLDPTLLLNKEDWMQILSSIDVPSEPYILLYELTPCRYIRQLAEHISSLQNWRIIRICKSANKEDKNSSILNIVDAGPAEFLHLFSEAALIITNSFHGTAFSVNFQRPFYTILPQRKQNNSRQRSLLELLNLTKRLLVEGDNFPENTDLMIDYTLANKILEQERMKSIQFLKEAIHGK